MVILTALEGMHTGTARMLLYVGITRARSHLLVVERGEVLEHYGLAG